MAKAREKKLGRGFGSLLGGQEAPDWVNEQVRGGRSVTSLPIDEVVPNPYQPRTEFDPGALEELVESLRTQGLMQPVIVRREEGRYELIAGERRWRAARQLGWSHIEGLVVEADARRMLEWAVVENVQRDDLGPLELAHSYRRLMAEFGLTQAQIAEAVGQRRPTITNCLRLLDLPDAVQDRVRGGSLAPTAARALLALPEESSQLAFADRMQAEGWNVRQLEDEVRVAVEGSPLGGSGGNSGDTVTGVSATPASGPGAGAQGVSEALPGSPPDSELAERLEARFGCPVRVKGTAHRGRIEFHFRSQEAAQDLLERLLETRDRGERRADADEGRLTV